MVSKYAKRFDGRKFDEIRKIEAKVGIIPEADGSAMYKSGDTIAIAAVFGPRTLHPQHMQNAQRGILRVNYDMMAFSVSDRKKPGPSKRSKEISKVIEWALEPCIDLTEFPNTVVDIFIQIPQADAGTRVAGINAAVMALAQAGIPMYEMASAISVGKLDKTLVVDLSKEEEDFKEGEGATDIPLCFLSRSKKISLLQLDGKISVKELKEVIKLGRSACEQINKIQVKALKEKKE
ncbi:MAG: exosome complex exonuclease Rrp41 [Nanoarchaeota archaeon]